MKDTKIGLKENIAIALGYAFGWISGLILLITETENKTVRYHAAQSIFIVLGLHIVQFILMISIIGIILIPVATLGFVILWIYLIINSFNGSYVRIKFIEDILLKIFNEGFFDEETK